MNRRDDSSSQDDGPDARLRTALDALPEERTPPQDSWIKLQGAMATAPQEAVRTASGSPFRMSRFRTAWVAVSAIAATLLLVLGTFAMQRVLRTPPDLLTGLSVDERRDPRVLALAAQTRNWHAAANDSVRSARWPIAARVAVDGAIASTNRALTSARAALARDPNDLDAREAVVTLREQQRTLLEHAMTLLDDI